MRSVTVTGAGELEFAEVPTPVIGESDVLIAMKACGVCGSDPHTLSVGGIPAGRPTRLGHEPAGEIVEVGSGVRGLAEGDRVVINPMGVADPIMGAGGAQGGLSEYVVVQDAAEGINVKVIPDHVPWHVAALNEPMAVARHGVNRTTPKPGDNVVVFGAGPIGLGALLAYKSLGAAHVVVVDVQPNRLEKALRIGADAVINSLEEDVMARLTQLHGSACDAFGRTGLPATDIYLDAAGVPAVLKTVFGSTKLGAVVGIVAIHNHPVEVDFGSLIAAELDIRLSMGYPDEIFQVTDDIVANWEKYALIVSDVIPFDRSDDAIDLAGRPGATDKVVIVFD